MSSEETLVFFNDTATTEIYTLSLHDALPICFGRRNGAVGGDHLGQPQGEAGLPLHRPQRPELRRPRLRRRRAGEGGGDRKSTRLNSSHANISYAVFCLKKKHIAPVLVVVIAV